MIQAMTPEKRLRIIRRHTDDSPYFDPLYAEKDGCFDMAHRDRAELLAELTRRDEGEAALRSQADGLAAALRLEPFDTSAQNLAQIESALAAYDNGKGVE